MAGTLVAAQLIASPAPSVSATTAQTFTPDADSVVKEREPTLNFGTVPNVWAAGPPLRRAYLRFPVANLAGAVSKATLRLYALEGNNIGFKVAPVASNAWSETTINWNNAPAIGAAVGGSGPVTAGQWASVDVTSLVAGNGSVSLALTTTSSTVTHYSSRETGVNAPQLVVETASTTTQPPSTTTTTTGSSSSGDPVLVAVGDIACDTATGAYNGGNGTASACRQKATSNLALTLNPTAVASLGDNQYDAGALAQFQTVYNPTWGRLKTLTKPAPGNHEYEVDTKATGYFTYFGSSAGDPAKGYYSYDLGSWHVVVLNSNCGPVGGCGAGSPQETWLRADLAAHPAACTMAYWHQPRWGSGEYGPEPQYGVFWQDLYAAGADLVLNGHEHDYERFAPQNPSGQLDTARGIREFVVGTGGRSHYVFRTILPTSERRNSDTFGVLKLTLHDTSYDWQFVPEAGKTFTDSGSSTCH